ncbi:MAG: thioredoxin [Deltaproteobacteria bacterium]|nr:MAG: thioredoxin [Deltaproteobacteria bacterium]
MKKPIHITDANFTEEVEESSTPVLIDFWAPWCAPCRMVAPVVEQLAEDYDGRLKVAKCDTDQNPQVATMFGIRSIPTVVLLDDGQVVDALIGARPKAAFEAMVDRYLKKREKRLAKEAKKAAKQAAAAG